MNSSSAALAPSAGAKQTGPVTPDNEHQTENSDRQETSAARMSSALATLKKTRRAPLTAGAQSEREIHIGPTYPDEAVLLRDLFPLDQSRPQITDSLVSLRSKVMQNRPQKEGHPPTDSELVSSMVKRLGQLERNVKAQALDINSKARRIVALEEKLKLLQEKTQGGKQEEDALSEKCHRLQNQVWEMEKFLNDYGMMWVGDCEDNDTMKEDSQGQPGASLGSSQFFLNFDLVLQNIKDLNILAGEGESCVTSVPGGARLTKKDLVPLWLYRNGIVMFSGPFRSYQDPSTQRCMQDLMDGYFPSELQERFPDGVIFKVYDRREEEFRVRQAAGFPGRGHTVRGTGEKPLDHREEDGLTLLNNSQSQLTGQKLHMEQFLKVLPENVVRQGKVINIRSSLRAHLQGCADRADGSTVSVIETPVLQALRERLESSKAEVTTLRVKSEDGEQTFILKMLFSDTIAHLRHHLDTHRGSSSPPYDIISAFPQRCYSDDTKTLLACGLTPNAALLLRPRPQEASLTTSPT